MTYRASYTISIDADESAHLVKVNVSKLRLLDELGVEPTSEFHHQQQHMIIGSTRKKDFSCIQFIKRAPY